MSASFSSPTPLVGGSPVAVKPPPPPPLVAPVGAATATPRRTTVKASDFPFRLYKMVDHCHKSQPEICSWVETKKQRGIADVSDEGGVFSGFLVHNVQALVEGYFRTYEFVNRNTTKPTTFSSFQRQLNLFGFSVRSPNGCVKVVRHEEGLFVRGRSDWLMHIKRRDRGTPAHPPGPAVPPTSPLPTDVTMDRRSPSPGVLEHKPNLTAQSLQSTLLGLQSAMFSQTNWILRRLGVDETELPDPLSPVGEGPAKPQPPPTVDTASPQYPPTHAPIATSPPVSSTVWLGGTAPPPLPPPPLPPPPLPPPPLGVMDPSTLYHPPSQQPQPLFPPQEQAQQQQGAETDAMALQDFPLQGPRGEAQIHTLFDGNLLDDEGEDILGDFKEMFNSETHLEPGQYEEEEDDEDEDEDDEDEDEDEETRQLQKQQSRKRRGDAAPQTSPHPCDMVTPKKPKKKKHWQSSPAGTAMDNRDVLKPRRSKTTNSRKHQQQQQHQRHQEGVDFPETPAIHAGEWNGVHDEYDDDERMEEWEGGPPLPTPYLSALSDTGKKPFRRQRLSRVEAAPNGKSHLESALTAPPAPLPPSPPSKASPFLRLAPFQFMLLAVLLVLLILLQTVDIVLSSVDNQAGGVVAQVPPSSSAPSGGSDGSLCPASSLLDVQRLTDPDDVVVDVSLSSNGTVAAILGLRTMEIWNLDGRGEWSMIRNAALATIFGGDTSDFMAEYRGLDVALSGDGQVVVVAVADSSSSDGGFVRACAVPSFVTLWKVATASLPRDEKDDGVGKSWVAVNEDGFWIVVSGSDSTVESSVSAIVYLINPNVATEDEEPTLRVELGSKGSSAAVSTSRDGQLVATLGLAENQVQLELEKQIRGDFQRAAPTLSEVAYSNIVRLAFSGDGSVVAFVRKSDNGNLPVISVLRFDEAEAIWIDHECGEVLELAADSKVVSLEWSDDATQLVASLKGSGGSMWYVWRQVEDEEDEECRWERTVWVGDTSGSGVASLKGGVVLSTTKSNQVGTFAMEQCMFV